MVVSLWVTQGYVGNVNKENEAPLSQTEDKVSV